MTERDRLDKSLIGVGRRHADVDDEDLRPQAPGNLADLVGLADLGHNLVTAFDEQLGQAVAQDRVVLGDRQPGHRCVPDGTTAVMVVGPPAGLSMSSRPSTI